MKKYVPLILGAIFAYSGVVMAAPIEWEPVGVNSDERDENSDYETSSGNQYQYNLNKPTDQILYEYDAPAQIRDRYDPRTQIDRNNGEYGGGVSTTTSSR